MRASLLAGVALAAAAAAPPDAAAQGGAARFMRDCAAWIEKKGYSVDYIEQRTGTRPSGNLAQDWVSNLDPQEAGPGDVVFVYVDSASARAQRAEVVDAVLKDEAGRIRAFLTSSMNVGRLVEPACSVTDRFGVVTQRELPFERIVRAWRPPKRP